MTGQAEVAQVVRSGVVESLHAGSVVCTAPDGSIEWSVGTVDETMLPRSCAKPIQAVGMVEAGLDLPPELLAIVCASHSGEGRHIDAVAELLDRFGLDELSLQCPPDYPMVEEFRHRWIADGQPRNRLAMNCSGKHAGMLAVCTVMGWSTETYLTAMHPLQRQIAQTIEDLTDETIAVTTVDGCGAPLFGVTLAGVARAFGQIAAAETGAAHRVAQAIRAHPELVSGSTRDEARLIRAVPGLIAKLGAEACYAVGLPDGRGLALKIADGSDRARPIVMAAALRRSGVELPDELAGPAPVYGGGDVVGEIRAVI